MNSLLVVLGCDWSWTVQSRTWPNLTQASYYSTHQDHVYNISDMVKLVAEGNKRGVRLVPFFETVGHSSMLGEGYPALMWCNGKQVGGRARVRARRRTRGRPPAPLWSDKSVARSPSLPLPPACTAASAGLGASAPAQGVHVDLL